MNLNFRSDYVIPKRFKKKYSSRFDWFNYQINHKHDFVAAEFDFPSILQSLKAVDEIANRCFRKYGVFPISFSCPNSQEIGNHSYPRQNFFSTTIPDLPYSFSSVAHYLDNYQKSAMALTHKKVGWDCFRHVEIMSVGTVPIMPDVRYIPEFTMVHYPKEFFKVSLEGFHNGLIPSRRNHEFILEWTRNHLTSISMARYMIRIAKLKPSRILFIDEFLPDIPDYLSCMTLIGLKQLYGSMVTVAYPVDYIYTDYQKDTTSLYGKGFGYTKILDKDFDTLQDADAVSIDSLKNIEVFSKYDLIVIGSVSRNLEISNLLSKKEIAANKIFIWGDDRPRSRKELKQIRRMDGYKFIREIY